MTAKPLVSVITPCFNNANTIAATIRSVQSQIYRNWELLIIDDCSTDSSVKTIEAFAINNERIKIYKTPTNNGPGVARNIGIENASGRFIAFLDADDKWTSDKLEKQVLFMLSRDYAFTYTNYSVVDYNDNIIKEIYAKESSTYNDLLKSNAIGCLTAMYDTSKIGKKYMPPLRKRQDLALWLSILKDIPAAHCLQENLALYKTGIKGSLSANKFSAAKYQWKLYRDIEKIGFIDSCLYFLRYSTTGTLKHLIYKLKKLRFTHKSYSNSW